MLRGERDPRSQTGALPRLGFSLAVFKLSLKAPQAPPRSGPGSGTAAVGSTRVALLGNGSPAVDAAEDARCGPSLGQGCAARKARPCTGGAGQPPPASLIAEGTAGAGAARSGTTRPRASPGRVSVGVQSPGGAPAATLGVPAQQPPGLRGGRAGLTLGVPEGRVSGLTRKGGAPPSLPFLPLPVSLFFAPLFFSKFPGGLLVRSKVAES